MVLIEICWAALGIAAVSFFGRAFLALLPPGELGSHRTAELPETWAASYLLGSMAVTAAMGFAALARVPLSCAWIAASGAVIGLARWLTLPAALVPRHEMLSERPGSAARTALLVALILGAWAAGRVEISAQSGLWAMPAQALLTQGSSAVLDDPSRRALASTPFDSATVAFVSWPSGAVSGAAARLHLLACMLAALLLAERAMRGARRAPLGRRVLLVLLAPALAAAATPEDGDLSCAALIALACCGLIAWTRKADARGLALASLGSCALPLVRPDGWLFGGAGLLALLVGSARPSSMRALRWVLGSVAGLTIAWPLALAARGSSVLDGEPLALLTSSWSLESDAWLAAWIAPIWIAFGAAFGPGLLRLLRRQQAERGATDDADLPRRDLAALFSFAIAMGVGALMLVAVCDPPASLLARTWGPGLLVASAPLAAVLAARVFVRAERGA